MTNTAGQLKHPTGDSSARLERRIVFSRRKVEDRRSRDERRFDSRVASVQLRKTIKTWLRSLTHLRLGVDRRKKNDRRNYYDRRNQRLGSILTREEIVDLLS
jgi:hypothetical protein